MTKIEKIAKLIGLSYTISSDRVWLQYDTSKREYNPLANKVDLMDVECALAELYEIKITLAKNIVVVRAFDYESPDEICYAIETVTYSIEKSLGTAVCAVAEQIYDKGQV